jgi:diacylglycerol kinase (ATP)
MRAAAIFGLGCSLKNLSPFQSDQGLVNNIEWRMGMPASGDEADVILLFGGDGTIHRHLGALVRLGLPVLVVPAGSGNDFARALGLRRMRDSLAAWREFCEGAGNVRRVDLGVISGGQSAGRAPAPHEPNRSPLSSARYFCCVAGVGLDGEVARRANGLPRLVRGHGGYLLSLVPAILTFTPLAMKISASGVDGDAGWITRSDQPTILAAFANTPVYGGGMKIAPQARMDDGLLDVCIVGSLDRFKLFCLFPTIYSGGHLNIREVDYFQAGRVRVEPEHPIDVYADGEFVGRTPVEISMHRAALRVVVPSG